MKTIRAALTIIGALTLIVSIPMLLSWLFESSSHAIRVTASYPSPDSQHTAWLFERSGGAWVWDSWCTIGVAVTNANSKVRTDQDAARLRVYEADCDNAPDVTWRDNSALQVQFKGVDSRNGLQVFMRGVDEMTGVKVKFQIDAQPYNQPDLREKPRKPMNSNVGPL
jgi:hypothetical protein